MTVPVRIIKGHYQEDGGSLAQGSLVLIDVPGKGICTEDGSQLRARCYTVAGVECFELYGVGVGFVFLPDKGECERVGIPVDSA